MEVNRFRILHASHLDQKYALEDKILKEYPQEIKRLTEQIDGYTADIRTLEQNTPADKETFPPMMIGGILYAEKTNAGRAIIEACKSMVSPNAVPLGEYRGFAMELYFDTFKEYHMALHGAMTHEVKIGADIHGNIARINNVLESFVGSLNKYGNRLADVRAQMESAKCEVNRPFPQEAEYQDKSARLKELNILLKLDEKDHEILDAEPDEGDIELKQPNRSLER